MLTVPIYIKYQKSLSSLLPLIWLQTQKHISHMKSNHPRDNGLLASLIVGKIPLIVMFIYFHFINFYMLAIAFVGLSES